MRHQATLLDRAIGHDRHAMLRQPRDQVIFGTTPGQVVEDLVGLAPFAAARDKFLHVFGVEVADAPAQDLAGRDQSLHCLDRFGQRHAPTPMQQVQVEPVGPEPVQARFAGVLESVA